jgi:disulfide bond formation protein DsbB
MISDEQIARMMGAGAAALVLGALGFQYLAHLAPCEMCQWQRWPHIAAAIIGLGVTPLWRNNRALALGGIALAAIAGLILAWQWGMLTGWQPKLIAVALLASFAVLFSGKDQCLPAKTAIALVLVSGLIAAYQTGMQVGLLPGPGACTVEHAYVMGSNAPPPEVSCNAVTWSLFGLSLAAYNALLSFLIAGTGILLLSRKHAA